MEGCKGLKDWLACSKCPDICTKTCPIEKDNVVEELLKRMRSHEDPTEYDSAFFKKSGFHI